MFSYIYFYNFCPKCRRFISQNFSQTSASKKLPQTKTLKITKNYLFNFFTFFVYIVAGLSYFSPFLPLSSSLAHCVSPVSRTAFHWYLKNRQSVNQSISWPVVFLGWPARGRHCWQKRRGRGCAGTLWHSGGLPKSWSEIFNGKNQFC